ncbi:MAG TPA: hypothetical protein VJ747_09460 [Stellaceae bacterium]|nr:hypothetical protein [Stellaceae bacterium]
MRLGGRVVVSLALFLFGGSALAQDLDFTAIPLPSEKDDIAAAKLAPAELKQILDQVEQTSFDAPDSWAAELRLRRSPIGGGEGLVVRGTALLCGGTGNCETWLFRRVNGTWTRMFDEEAPVISSLGFGRHVSHGIADLIATAHLSASTSTYLVYVFDGKVYRPGTCYEVAADGAKRSAKQTTCK